MPQTMFTSWNRHISTTPEVIASLATASSEHRAIKMMSLILFNDSGSALSYTVDIYNSVASAVAVIVAKGSIPANDRVVVCTEQTPFFVPSIAGATAAQVRVTAGTASVMDYLCTYTYESNV